MNTKTIVALDFDNICDAKNVVEKIGEAITYYKIGLELYLSAGLSIIEYLKNKDKKIFLDLKFHDIPNTVSKAVIKASSYGVDMMNVHSQGGFAMMKVCADSLGEVCYKKGIQKPLLIAVTLLTSLDETHLKEFGISDLNTEDYVLRLACAVQKSGLDGVVSSVKETQIIKNELGASFITVTPGIRPSDWDTATDQKRVVTPADAKKLGTDYVVIGRPITYVKDPRQAALNILKELA